MSFPPARSRAGFVTACQQVLALGVVLAVLTPAAGVVSLDVVHDGDRTDAGPPADAASEVATTGPADAAPALVAAAATEAEVDEYQLTAPAGARVAPGSLRARTTTSRGAARVTSEALPVEGYGTVGVTWGADQTLSEDAVDIDVRMKDDDRWSGWTDVEYHADHAPDPDSPEAAGTRPGTDPVVVGEVDDVQVRVETGPSAPEDLRLAVIEPGATDVARQQPALDTGAADDGAGAAREGLALAAATSAPRPQIFSRAQWGADESLRDRGSLRYGTVSGGFVHHTVTANGYSRAQVPGIMRSIYAYHTRSRGWSDIGYNFLVDRFGRIWEGRYGGVARSVVGAHTLGYNDYSFAMSAIGNYEVTGPSSAMVQAYGALFAWKLGINGVDAASMRQRIGSRYFAAVNGHRDAGSTACPGRYLYAKIPQIRDLAAKAQDAAGPVTVTDLESDLAGDRYPDLVLKRRSDQQAVVIPTGGLTGLRKARVITGAWDGWRDVAAATDLTGDGVDDLLLRRSDGTTGVAAGRGAGDFAAPVVVPGGPGAAHEMVSAAGDVDGDGHDDLLARRAGTSRLVAFLGDGRGGLEASPLGLGWARYDLLVPAGDLTGDSDPDLLAREADGTLSLRPGAGGTAFGAAEPVAGRWGGWDRLAVPGDVTGDGNADLVGRLASSGKAFVMPGLGGAEFGRGRGPLGRVGGARTLTGGGEMGGGGTPDLVMQRRGKVWRVSFKPTTETRAPIETGLDLSSAGVLVNVGDWDGDGRGDLVTRSSGAVYLHRGNGSGGFAARSLLARGFARTKGISAVGDVTDDGRPDLVGRRDGGWQVFPGRGTDGVGAARPASAVLDGRDGLDLSGYRWVRRIADARGRGRPDLVARDADGVLWLLPVGKRGVGQRRFLTDGMGAYGTAG